MHQRKRDSFLMFAHKAEDYTSNQSFPLYSASDLSVHVSHGIILHHAKRIRALTHTNVPYVKENIARWNVLFTILHWRPVVDGTRRKANAWMSLAVSNIYVLIVPDHTPLRLAP
jgi:hypothetical protein